MNPSDIVRRRLAQQLLSGNPLARPEEVVAWLGAVQAQDYAGAKWGIGQRTTGLTESALDAVFNDGTLIRTHVLRPTWHFVTPADLRTFLALTGPRIIAQGAPRYRELGLDEATLERATTVLAQALHGGQQLTRTELATVLEGVGIFTQGQRMPHMLGYAELKSVICSGPRRGKQFTFALLEERVPPAPVLGREAALADLTRRYFRTRGPATVQDFAWWSGLAMADIRLGIELIRPEITSIEIEGRPCWMMADGTAAEGSEAAARPSDGHVAHLLPAFDEYFIGYRDRSAITIATAISEDEARVPHAFNNALLLDGFIVGAWQRTLKRERVLVEIRFGIEPTPAQRDAVAAAAQRYGDFLGLAAETRFLG